jgi:signal transduction histidine kinase/ligand-binding sensor domain-containing protein
MIKSKHNLLLRLNSCNIFTTTSILILFLNNIIWAQTSDLILDNYNTSHGLSQNSCLSVDQDNDGFIWVATQDGINRFDGREFMVWQNVPGDSLSLPQNHINNMFIDDNQHICLSTYGGGFSILNPKSQTFENVKIPNGVQKENVGISIFNAVKDENGSYWLAGENGLIIKNKTGLVLSKLKGSCIGMVYKDTNNRIWVFDDEFRIHVFSATNQNILTTIPLPYIDNVNNKCEIIKGIYELENEDLILLTVNGLMKASLDKNGRCLISKINFPEKKELEKIAYLCMLKLENGNYWLGTKGKGIIELDDNYNFIGNIYPNVNSVNGLRGKIIYDLFKDKAGSIWIGSELGLQVYHKKNNDIFSIKAVKNGNGLNLSMTFSILNFSKNFYYVGTVDGVFKVNKFDGNGHIIYKKPNNTCYSMYKDNYDNTWFGFNEGLQWQRRNDYKINNNYLKEYAELKPLRYKTISAIIEYNDHLVFGVYDYDGGLYFWDRKNKTLKHFNTKKGNPSKLPSEIISCLYVDPNKNLWIGTENGFAKYNPVKEDFEAYLPTLNVKNSLNCPFVYSIDSDGKYLWLATYGGGLIRFDPIKKVFKNFTTQNGLSNNTLYSARFVKDSTIWCSHNRGLSRFNINTETFHNFFKEDGLQDNEFNHFAYLYDSSTDKLVFGGVSGISIVNPNYLRKEITPISTKIVEVNTIIDGILSNALLYHKNTFQNNENDFIFHFASLNLKNPTKNKFRCKLVGWDKTWIDLGTTNQAIYSNLPHGIYTLLVQSADNLGEWNNNGDSYKFTIIPAFYQTLWFKSLLGLLGFFLIYFIINIRIKHKFEKSILQLQKEKEILQIRQNIAQDIHDDIGSDLTKINLLSKQENDSSITKSTLQAIQVYATNITNHLGEIIFAMNPNYDNYKDLSSFIRETINKQVEFTEVKIVLNIQEIIDDVIINPEVKRQLIFIVKEFINNTLKYAHASHFYCQMYVKHKNELIVELKDNGIGFDMNKIKSFSNGLNSLKSRAEKMNAQLNFYTQPGDGCTLKITITL